MISPKELLLKYPNSPYSAFHTRQGTVVLFEKHLERLQVACSRLSQKMPLDILAAIQRPYQKLQRDASFIIIIYENEPIVWCKPFVVPKLESCGVVCFGEPRIDPTIKNTSWMSQRQYIEKVKPIGIDEMILIKDSNLYEGLVTNFFAVVEDEDGALAVITAPFDFVLPGIIAQAIVDMLSKSCIHFRFEFPDLKRHKWKGAFLTNANRWIQPVHSIATLQQEFHTFDHFEFILKMQSNLYTYLHDRGTKL